MPRKSTYVAILECASLSALLEALVITVLLGKWGIEKRRRAGALQKENER
jgi:hypothetical protein